ncbi:RING-type E3 ubiquitin transferase [Ranunculus cassubicifolius]
MTEQVEVRYMNADTRGIVEENFEIYFPEIGNLSLEEVLQQQESVYLSLQANNRNRATASGSTGDNVEEPSGGQQQAVGNEGESLQVGNPNSQLELDEALALSLQELENQFSGSSVDGDSESESVNAEVNSAETSTEAAREDTVDPDNMTYEELQSLGDEIGAESRGLSDELLEYLPSYKYKTGFFKKEKHEDCVICCMTYRNREKLTMLPCQHQYHSDCIKKWLKINKACPVCNEEVFGS